MDAGVIALVGLGLIMILFFIGLNCKMNEQKTECKKEYQITKNMTPQEKIQYLKEKHEILKLEYRNKELNYDIRNQK